MSIVKIQATPTGTGTVTITAPTTNSDRTVTLPDTTGTLYISGGDIGTPSAGNASNLTNLNASNLATGTVPDARFPATLPAASGANLTALNASNLASGTVGTARLGTGTANSTTFLRGDGTWATAGGDPTTAQVLNATAGASAGAVGSYMFGAAAPTNTAVSFGATRAGSQINPTGGWMQWFNGAAASSLTATLGSTQSGTWRCMGVTSRVQAGCCGLQYSAATLWLRIS